MQKMISMIILRSSIISVALEPPHKTMTAAFDTPNAFFFHSLWGEWSIVYMILILGGCSVLLFDQRLTAFGGPAVTIGLLTAALAMRVVWMCSQMILSTSTCEVTPIYSQPP